MTSCSHVNPSFCRFSFHFLHLHGFFILYLLIYFPTLSYEVETPRSHFGLFSSYFSSYSAIPSSPISFFQLHIDFAGLHTVKGDSPISIYIVSFLFMFCIVLFLCSICGFKKKLIVILILILFCNCCCYCCFFIWF